MNGPKSSTDFGAIEDGIKISTSSRLYIIDSAITVICTRGIINRLYIYIYTLNHSTAGSITTSRSLIHILGYYTTSKAVNHAYGPQTWTHSILQQNRIII